MNLGELIEYLTYLRDSKYSSDTKVYSMSGFGYWGDTYTNNAPSIMNRALLRDKTQAWIEELGPVDGREYEEKLAELVLIIG